MAGHRRAVEPADIALMELSVLRADHGLDVPVEQLGLWLLLQLRAPAAAFKGGAHPKRVAAALHRQQRDVVWLPGGYCRGTVRGVT